MKKRDYYYLFYWVLITTGAGYFLPLLGWGIIIGFNLCLLIFVTVGKTLDAKARAKKDAALEKIIDILKKSTDGNERAQIGEPK